MYHESPFSRLKCIWVCFPKDTHVPSNIYEKELAISLVCTSQESPSYRPSWWRTWTLTHLTNASLVKLLREEGCMNVERNSLVEGLIKCWLLRMELLEAASFEDTFVYLKQEWPLLFLLLGISIRHHPFEPQHLRCCTRVRDDQGSILSHTKFTWIVASFTQASSSPNERRLVVSTPWRVNLFTLTFPCFSCKVLSYSWGRM